jgi:hypothetical protein
VNVVTHEYEPLTARDRLRITLAVLVGCVIFVVGVGILVIVIRTPPPPQESGYLRDIYVLFDVSYSMDPKRRAEGGANFAKAKELAAGIVNSCGPGDWVGVLTVGTGFSEDRNIVVDAGVLPVPMNFRDELIRRQADEEIATLRRTAADTIEDRKWLQEIEQVAQEPPDGRSDYLEAFDYVARRVRASARRDGRQTQILAFGDLEQTQMHPSGKPPAPAEADADAFAGVRIHLSYPYRGGRAGQQASREQLESYWREYFEQRGATDITIAPFGSRVALRPALAND